MQKKVVETKPYEASGTARFTRLSRWIAQQTGRSTTFILALFIIALWAITGPLFHYSDTWQLVINTGTTIVTFLMVFLIQNTQNRESLAIHLKLDELIRAKKGARNALLDLDDLSDEELLELRLRFTELGARAKREGGKIVKTEITLTHETDEQGGGGIEPEERRSPMTVRPAAEGKK